MGLSVFLPKAPTEGADTLRATVTFADYIREEQLAGDGKKRRVGWRRVPQPPRHVDLVLSSSEIEKGVAVPDTPGIFVSGKLEAADAPGLDPGTRALSLFVVNRRAPGEKGRQDEQFIFQVKLELSYEGGFAKRPSRQGEDARDFDDRVADLQFREHFEWAVGHGVSVEAPEIHGPVTRLCTTWIPRQEVRRIITREERKDLPPGEPAFTTDMETLGALPDGAAAREKLGSMVEACGLWIEAQGG